MPAYKDSVVLFSDNIFILLSVI